MGQLEKPAAGFLEQLKDLPLIEMQQEEFPTNASIPGFGHLRVGGWVGCGFVLDRFGLFRPFWSVLRVAGCCAANDHSPRLGARKGAFTRQEVDMPDFISMAIAKNVKAQAYYSRRGFDSPEEYQVVFFFFFFFLIKTRSLQGKAFAFAARVCWVSMVLACQPSNCEKLA